MADIKNGTNMATVTQRINDSVKKTGDVILGDLDIGDNKIYCEADTFEDNELVNKGFVNEQISKRLQWSAGDNIIFKSNNFNLITSTFQEMIRIVVNNSGTIKLSFKMFGQNTNTYGEVKVFVGEVQNSELNTNCVIHKITDSSTGSYSNNPLVVTQNIDVNVGDEISLYMKKSAGSGYIYVTNFAISVSNNSDIIYRIV